jgi:hypothetical protein
MKSGNVNLLELSGTGRDGYRDYFTTTTITRPTVETVDKYYNGTEKRKVDSMDR